MSFAADEILDCENSVYKNDLSQTPSDLTQREKLQWLQSQRTTGLWVQCDDCDRWRYLPDVLDNHKLPEKWYCSMHPDISLNECSVPEIPMTIRDTEEIFYGEYAAGSIVLAKLDGWPWWPAMVDDCPDTEKYYWLDGFSDIPTHYHVVFFDAGKVSRAWLSRARLRPYSLNKDLMKTAGTNKKYVKRLEFSAIQADDAEKLPLQSRLKIYSFIARYTGKIGSPHKKRRKQEKKKKNHQSPKSRKHKNIIFLGSKKHKKSICYNY